MRNLIEEVRNRRVLAFAALGVLVALALPLLFLKSAPEGAPTANTAAPAPAKEAKLPARAARLLATSDRGAAGGQAKGSAEDPFSPPQSYLAAAAASAAATGDAAATPAATPSGAAGPQAAAGGGAPDKPVEVVVTNPGTTPSTSTSTSKSTAGNGNGSSSSRRSSSLTARTASVDVRYGKKANTKIRRAIPRQKGFYIHGKLVAAFVKYSPSRKAAVFAVAPGVFVSGAAKCRAQDGVCRYVDIPAGEHAWLTVALPSRTIVSRRLDVVHIKRRTARSKTRAASAAARSDAACLARKLVAMERGDALLDRDACQD